MAGVNLNNPNAAWENCDYWLWPEWYGYVSWGALLALCAYSWYCSFVLGL